MGIQNKAFAFFTKGIGAATGFAKNHMFPAMATDYKAIRTGLTAGFRDFRAGRSMMNIRPSLGRGMRTGMEAAQGVYRRYGMNSNLGMYRLGAYGVSGAGVGMWGLNQIGGNTTPSAMNMGSGFVGTNPRRPYGAF
jgi:hypothetical protein